MTGIGAGRQPIVVHAQEPPVGAKLVHRRHTKQYWNKPRIYGFGESIAMREIPLAPRDTGPRQV